MFGPSSIYHPKKILHTKDGFGTIPDGFAIDLASQRWYLVEAELIRHNVWRHIAPQVSKQLIAARQPLSRKIILEMAVEQCQADPITKEKFVDLKIKEINIRRALSDILEGEPIVGLPIDHLSDDLEDL